MSQEFLEAVLMPSGPTGKSRWAELRMMKKDSERPRVEQVWFPLNAERELTRMLETARAYDIEDAWDAYFGVLPRTRRGGATADDVDDRVHVLWADIDGKHFAGGDADAFAAISEVDLTPSIVVSSGGGYHVYWLLRRSAAYTRARLAMKGIAETVGGDNVSDASRILRVPGTHNHKYDPPKMVRLLHFLPRRKYRIEDFADYIDLAMPPDRPHHVSAGPVTGELEDRVKRLDDWLYDLVVYALRDDGSQIVKGERSEAAFKAMLWLARFGWSDEQILEAFQAYPEGIGAKYHEKGSYGDRWFWYSMPAARTAAEEGD